MHENVDKFLSEFSKSLKAGTFVKMTLGNYKGADEHLQKMLVRLVSTKKGARLYFLYRGATRDTAKNFDFDTGVALIGDAIDSGFNSGHLFTTEHDYQLEVGKKGKSRLNRLAGMTAKKRNRSAPTVSICVLLELRTTTAESATVSRINGGRSINLSRFWQAWSTNPR